jgi:hypothetical protein
MRSVSSCQTKCLPSGDAALDLVTKPSPEGLLKAVGTMAMRGVLVAGGLYVAGARGSQLAGYTVAATKGIEVGVIGWALWASYR